MTHDPLRDHPTSIDAFVELEHESLWRLHEHHATYRRHHETQRAAISTAIVALAAAIIAVIASQSGIDRNDAVGAVVLIGVGVVGMVISQVERDRYKRHLAFTHACEQLLDELIPSQPIDRARKRKKKLEKEKPGKYESHRGLGRLELHRLWVILNLVIMAIGIAILAVSLFG